MKLYGISIIWRDSIFEAENKTVLRRLYPQPPAQVVIDEAVNTWLEDHKKEFEAGRQLIGVGKIYSVHIIDFVFAKQ